MTTIPERRIALGASFHLDDTAPTLMPGDTITIEAHATVETVSTGIDWRGEPYTTYHVKPDHRDDCPDAVVTVAGLKTAPTDPYERFGTNRGIVIADPSTLIADSKALADELRQQAADMEAEITERKTKAEKTAARARRIRRIGNAAAVALIVTGIVLLLTGCDQATTQVQPPTIRGCSDALHADRMDRLRAGEPVPSDWQIPAECTGLDRLDYNTAVVLSDID